LKNQCNEGAKKYGAISKMVELKENLGANCIPESIFEMTLGNYDDFLKQRQVLIANKIRDYYFSL